jgi:pantoate--beta-alanine ligase
MIILKRSKDCYEFLRALKGNKSIGFVPTMGALHEGHLSLIKSSMYDCNITVCSIFVNPTQFNNPDDLENYPSTIEQDVSLLEATGCDILFLPDAYEIYPDNLEVKVPDVQLDELGTVMEGAKRPGHFDGVLQVVNRLLQITIPDRLYMGQKDFQQQLIISRLLKTYYKDIVLVTIPTAREKDGLAMSSRNKRLDKEWRQKAPTIFESLNLIASGLPTVNIDPLIQKALDKLSGQNFVVEYIEVADSDTLLSLKKVSEKDKIIICTAVYAGEIRLIDNILWPENAFQST